MPLANRLDCLLAANAVVRCQVPFLHLVLGSKNINEDGVQHEVVQSQACCTHLHGKLLNPIHVLERVAARRYLETIKASAEVGCGPCRLLNRLL